MALVVAGILRLAESHNNGTTAAIPAHKIVYISTDKDRKFFDIYMMNADGTSRNRITRTSTFEYDPVLSPDGTKIAFAALVHPKDRRTNLFIINADGSGQRQITQNPSGKLVQSPAWSPDGEKLLFIKRKVNLEITRWGGPPLIYLVDADENNLLKLGEGVSPSWFPDGRSILFTNSSVEEKTKNAFFRMDIDSRRVKTVSKKSGWGTLSPDGKKIAYVTDLGESLPTETHSGEPVKGVCVMYSDGSYPVLLKKFKWNIDGVQWINKENRIIATNITDLPLAFPNDPTIYAIDIRNKSAHKLTDKGAWSLSSGGYFGMMTAMWMIDMYSNNGGSDQKRPFFGWRLE
jgi:Tol biopolymer transport system component